MEKVDYMISLEELFKRDKFQISDLVKALNIDEGDEIINRLFLFLNAKIEWGLVPYVQSLLLARTIRGDLEEYPPFFWK